MIKFSKILENKKSGVYKAFAYIELEIESEDEGEAAYVADSTLSSVKNVSDYGITKIEKLEIIGESKNAIKKELEKSDWQMVSGIIDILKKVKDIQNRMDIASDMIRQFKKENIKFDYNNFLDSIK